MGKQLVATTVRRHIMSVGWLPQWQACLRTVCSQLRLAEGADISLQSVHTAVAVLRRHRHGLQVHPEHKAFAAWAKGLTCDLQPCARRTAEVKNAIACEAWAAFRVVRGRMRLRKKVRCTATGGPGAISRCFDWIAKSLKADLAT